MRWVIEAKREFEMLEAAEVVSDFLLKLGRLFSASFFSWVRLLALLSCASPLLL